jgi:ABC-type nitrate/sulfonate/bicarbonate transport system substrate-binding protein
MSRRSILSFWIAGVLAYTVGSFGVRAEEKPLRYVVSTTPTFTVLPVLVAQNLTFPGLSKELNRKVDVTYTPTPDTAVLGLLAGEYDFAALSVQHVIRAQAEGRDLVILASLMDRPTVAMIARADLPEIKSPADAKGRVFGLVGLGSAHQMFAYAAVTA